MKNRLILLFLTLLPFISIGQNKTYLGLEVGPKFEIYQSTDNGDGLYTKPFFFSPIYGAIIERGINKTFSGEIGFYFNDYGESYRIEGAFGYGTSNAILAFQIPLRLKARLPLVKDKVRIIPAIGYIIAINNDYGSSGSGSSFTRSVGPQYNDSTRTQSASIYNFKKVYGLFEIGTALDYQIKKSLILYLSGNYVKGFSKIVDIDVSYRINDAPEQTGNVFSNGDYYSIVFGIKYPISNLWKKNKKR